MVATLSNQTPNGEWTAPTTPILLLYKEWPGASDLHIGEDALVVGTIGSLHDWIKQDQADFEYLWRTIIFGALSASIAIFLLPRRRPQANENT